MLDTFNEYRKRFQEQLLNDISGYHYRFTRHHQPYSIALVYVSETDVSLDTFETHLRESDTIIFLKANLCAIIFDDANEEQGLKAAENLLSLVQDICFTKHLYMAVVTVNSDINDFQTVHDLFDLIAYALDHNMDNSVLEKSQIIKNA
ncbi:MAG TPA: hypothetical protein PLM93_04820 [Sulfuricurvum sp.]|nr:MAG: hypothetical protein B7Y30_03985 [Campylobacterales bacterium 16-40-21]OZA03311.1 MAG: hypothetical protein B7X89_04790 [Sulfuricurvum sp. 17-40-25]HQS66495.1 hypothetical protein [Sulfuricurvum sp.]HQT36494.1 hypothetical protein [Sulfuricurvum sp.]